MHSDQFQTSHSVTEREMGVNILIVDRFNRVLVDKGQGYAFEPRSTDLTDAVVFDDAGADDVIGRIALLKQTVNDGPYTKRTVRDFKTDILEAFADEINFLTRS